MNKIEKLADLKFNGDIKKAMYFLVSECTPETQTEYFRDMNSIQKNKCANIMKKYLNEFIPGGLDIDMDLIELSQDLNISEEELSSMKKIHMAQNCY